MNIKKIVWMIGEYEEAVVSVNPKLGQLLIEF